MRVQFDATLPASIVEGIAPGHDVPDELADMPLDRLRLVDGKVIDAATLRAFWLDERGRRHAEAGEGRQKVRCAWDAAIDLAADGKWRVRTQSDDLDDARMKARRKIIAYADTIAARITGQYPQAEVMTWDAQEAEAKAVLAGDALEPDALLLQMAAAAKTDIKAYATRVMAKARGYRSVVIAVKTIRDQAEAALEACASPTEVDAAMTALRAAADARAAELGLA